MKQDRISRIFSHIPTLETPRLLLRKMLPSDAADMYDYARREEVTKYLLWEPHPDRSYTARYLRYVQTLYREGEFSDWAVIWKQNGKMIGTCGFTSFDLPNGRGEVGYVISPDYRGMGIAPEAVMAALQFGFEELELSRIEAKYIFGNDPSRRVMEKCGMTFEGVLRSYMIVREQARDIGICAILQSEYEAIRARSPEPFAKRVVRGWRLK